MMPRMMMSDWTPSRLEDEAAFTRGALKANTKTQDLLPLTDEWLPAISGLSEQRRELRLRVGEHLAERSMAHSDLSDEVRRFARTLLFELDNDRTDTRFVGFFPEPPSALIAGPHNELITRVKSWLMGSQDAALEQHRAALTELSARSELAIEAGEALRLDRMERDRTYSSYCTQLSVERDHLHSKLRERAQESGLSLSWADTFYKRG